MQEVFNFHQVENLSWNDFVESDENREAVAWLSQWPKFWRNNGAVIYGEPKVGKTYIASLWARTASAIYVLESGFSDSPRNLFQANCNFVIDNFDSFANIDEWMFDFVNICKEKNRFFLLISRTKPSMWNINLQDLRSRLAMLPAINIKMPSDDSLMKITRKISQDLGAIIADEVLNYIMAHVTRDVATLSETLKVLNKLSMQKQKPITIPFVRKYTYLR